MSYNGSGTFQINTSGQPVVTGTSISSTVFNALTADLATGLSTAITKDGQTTTTARIPFALGINSTLVTDATNTTSGSIITAGGVGIAKALFVGTTANVAGAVTLGGVATFSAQPIFSSLTASSAVATDASKGLVSVTNTGTGNNVLATAPTLTGAILNGTIGAITPASGAFTTLSATGDITLSGSVGRVVSNADSKRVLIAGGSSASTTSGAYAIFEGYDFGGAGAGGAISLVSAAGTTNPITMIVGGTTRGVFSSTGLAVTGLTDISAATSGQIKFPATPNASSNANTLDDYEEGTWPPTLTAYAGSITAYTSQGSYVKIGRIVFATVYAVVSNAGTASGAYIISNLPFPLATSAEVYGYGVNLLTNVGLVAYGSGSTSLYCFTAAGAFPGGSGTYVSLNFNYSV
jgi:hypothetical protein